MQKRKIIIFVVLIMIFLLLFMFLHTKRINKLKEIAQAQNENTFDIDKETFLIKNLLENNIEPTISAGMIPVKYNGANWVITSKEDSNWYNYGQNKPAYIMLNDGSYQSEIVENMQSNGKMLASEHINEIIEDDENVKRRTNLSMDAMFCNK